MTTCSLIAPQATETSPREKMSAQVVRAARARGRLADYLLLVLAGSCLFMVNLGGPSLWDLDEGRNATAALEMLDSGNFVVPTFNGHLRSDKPVLLYWCQAVCFQFFGVNEYAARLPSALAALLTLLICYELGRSMFGPSAGLLAGLVAGSTGFFVASSHFANPDALLNLFITGALAVFWHGQRKPRSGWFIGIGVLLGLAALAKGPVGLLLPGLIAVAYLAWEKRLKILWDRRVWRGGLAFSLIALPWYAAVTVETRGDFLRAFLSDHNVRRFLSPLDNHDGPPLYYVLALLAGMAPWSVFLLLAIGHWTWSSTRAPRDEPLDGRTGSVAYADAHRFLGVWLGLYLVFFSLAATKLPNYILPTAVPSALWIASFLDRYRRGQIALPRWIMPLGVASLAVVGVTTFIVFSNPSALLPAGLQGQASQFNVELVPWRWAGLIPATAALTGYWYWRRDHATAAVASVVIGNVLGIFLLVAWASPCWNRIKAAGPLTEKSGATNTDRDIRVGAYQLEHLPSLNFYVRRQVAHHMSEAASLAFLGYQVPVYLFLPALQWEAMKDRAPSTARVVAKHPDFYRSNIILVVTNQPAGER